MSARYLAYKILFDIEVNGNYSNMALNKYLNEAGLDDQDKGFVTELVYGIIEKKRYLDYMINKVSKIKVRKMQHSVKLVLRMGVYQLVYMDGVTDYAAINESVNIMKKLDKRSASFVNAVLRNISRNLDEVKDISLNTVDKLAIYYSYENWIVENLVKEYGFERTEAILRALSQKPNIYLRVNRTKLRPGQSMDYLVGQIIGRIIDQGLEASRVEGLEEAIKVKGLKSIDKHPLFREGYVSVQDISSILVAKVMNPKRESRVLDLCAAPGGKSTHIGELMENTGHLISQDIFDHKIKLMNTYARRLGLNNMEARLGDALVLNDDYIGKFDYVLCDVPCSGMGIVRRKPEIKYKKEEEVLNLPDLQYQILENASSYLKEGGILIYSTCTIFRQENMEVVDRFLANHKDFDLDDLGSVKEFLGIGDKDLVKILPDRYEMDGFFICRMKKI
ncbi:ribosomal RNA small subunit methyltransferase B [Peptostreptococcus stomatis DSM 17678]|uniref:16S rRNA (cytosine(967)-C(5))-methyltransferase n=1 Tax=Peptostreptococcus stomatis DSM 17678 TaxID=596315 RepID=E0E4G2_9FIRM|nr:16S rRNA (cytosine(967)-C(5))-methyltransferase RsmB [Peptostreptococcus stomatis]EFM64187.1 ribosomal RNA small subunit methyltransferase B [Peptostreptococcus stomatis DSM 17678]